MNTYNLMYLISKWYLIIAGINWVIVSLVIFSSLQQYLEQTGAISLSNTFVKFMVGMLAPVVCGLGWIFFVPVLIYNTWFKKEK